MEGDKMRRTGFRLFLLSSIVFLAMPMNGHTVQEAAEQKALKSEWDKYLHDQDREYINSYKNVTHFNKVGITCKFYGEKTGLKLDDLNEYVIYKFKSYLPNMLITPDAEGAAQMNFTLYLLKIDSNHYIADLTLECPPIIGYNEKAFYSNMTYISQPTLGIEKIIKKNIDEMIGQFAKAFYEIRQGN